MVRDAQPADLPAVLWLEQSVPGAAHCDESQYTRIFDPAAARRVLLVADGKTHAVPQVIGGFILARVVHDEWEIENVAVAEEWRRKGVGQLLVVCLTTRARREDARAVRLEVRASNAPAIALYSKCGFQQDGIRKGYYSNPTEDALLFSLSLKNAS